MSQQRICLYNSLLITYATSVRKKIVLVQCSLVLVLFLAIEVFKELTSREGEYFCSFLWILSVHSPHLIIINCKDVSIRSYWRIIQNYIKCDNWKQKDLNSKGAKQEITFILLFKSYIIYETAETLHRDTPTISTNMFLSRECNVVEKGFIICKKKHNLFVRQKSDVFV